MKINTKIKDAKWFDYNDEVKFKLRPFPLSKGIFMPEGGEQLAKAGWDRFNFCLVGWEGLTDEEGNNLECNEKNKQFIFDYVEDLTTFILNTTTEFSSEAVVKEKDLKN